jgi:hypothetical protein
MLIACAQRDQAKSYIASRRASTSVPGQLEGSADAQDRLDAIEQINRTGYPPPYTSAMAKRHYRRLAPGDGAHGLRRQPCRA